MPLSNLILAATEIMLPQVVVPSVAKPIPWIWVPILVMCAYTPVLCYLDLKYRDIFSHKIWIPAVIINSVFTFAFIVSGKYEWWMFVLSLIQIIFWCMVLWVPPLLIKKEIINGADFVFLILISAFVIINPISGHLMMLPFMFFLIMWTLISLFWIATDKIRDHLIFKDPLSPHQIFLVDRGYPMMVTISLALLTAVVFG